MLSDGKLDLVWNIDCVCRDCIRAAVFMEVVANATPNTWKFTHHCFARVCVQDWCKVFGTDREDTHWKNLVRAFPDSQITEKGIRERLWEVAGGEQSYEKAWEEAKGARDRFFSHNDFRKETPPVMPDTELLKRLCLELREIMREILSEAGADKWSDDSHRNSPTILTNDRILVLFSGDGRLLMSAVGEMH